MIKLITPKRDLYMDGDTNNPHRLFGKKGVFYEVKGYGYEGEDIMFVDEREVEHSYGLDFVDKDFWTVDFDKGFEFLSAMNVPYYMKNNKVFSKAESDNKILYTEETISMACDSIKQGGWTITRFSNQPEQPSVEERPFENWKKDIGLAKFQRCIEKTYAVMCVIDDINGYLDIKNNLFYYHKKHRGQHTYLCCKVESSLDKGWHFVRENKDSSLLKQYTPEAKGMVAKEDVLASFSVPIDNKDTGQQESSKDEGGVYSADANTWSDKHYDFSYTLTEEDIETGKIKIDPYFVSYQWKLGEKDNSGALWHCFKGIARFGEKNPVEREIKALHAQVKRLAEIHKVSLG